MQLKVVNVYGVPLSFVIEDNKENIQQHWLKGNIYENHKNGMLRYMYENKQRYEGKVIIDIGACIGNHSVFFNSVLKMEVHAFEPVQSNFEHLVKNFNLNCKDGRVTCYMYALGSYAGEVTMEQVEFSSVGNYEVRRGRGTRMERLDDIILEEMNAEYIKIDVEEHELEVLLGGMRTINNAKEVFIEIKNVATLHRVDEMLKEFNRMEVFNHTPTYRYVKKTI